MKILMTATSFVASTVNCLNRLINGKCNMVSVASADNVASTASTASTASSVLFPKSTSRTSLLPTEPLSTDSTGTSMSIDQIYSEIGDLGPQQLKYVVALSLMRSYKAMNLLDYAISGRSLDFTCMGAGAENAAGDGQLQERPLGLNQCPELDEYGNKACPEGIQFVKKGETSIVSQWNLVCGDDWLAPFTMSIMLMGYTAGTLLLGPYSDRHGRKQLLFFSLVMLIMSNQGGAMTPNYYLYCFFRAMNGFFNAGLTMGMVVLENEIVGKSKRGMAAAVYSVGFALGLVFLSCFGYFQRDWQLHDFYITLYGTPLLAFYFFLPESPRWLLTKGRTQEANAVVKKIVVGNGYPYKDKYLLHPPHQEHCSQSVPSPTASKLSIRDFFKHYSTTMIMVTLSASWTVAFILYMGLTLMAGTDSGDLYIGTILSGVSEIPGDFFGVLLLKGLGRKNAVAGLLLVSGATLTSVFSLGQSSPPAYNLACLILAKMSASAIFNIFNIHTNEIFPTVIRSTGFGLVLFISRMLGMSMPYLVQLGNVYPNLHFLVFGLMALSSMTLNKMFLPETAGKHLPESMDDVFKLLRE